MNKHFGRALAAASLLSIGISGTASAADMAVKAQPMPPPVAVYNWTGFYIGGFGGYGWGNHDRINDAGFANSYSSSGAIAGGLAGYNWQIKNFVLGVEGDLAWADIKGNDNFTGGTLDETTLRWVGTIRGRAGIAIDKWLLFGTAGWAYGQQRHVNTNLAVGIDAFSSNTSGWTAGAGVEYAFAPNWLGKVEYRYYDFERYSRAGAPVTTPNGNVPYSVASQYQTVTVGVSYKFGGAVVARY
jgi:outer membrane immunogenic protein